MSTDATLPRYLSKAIRPYHGPVGGELPMAARCTVPNVAVHGEAMTGLEGLMRSGACALVLLLAALVAGCGAGHKSSSQAAAKQQVTQAVRSYLQAQTAGDGQAACALLTAGGQQQLTTLVMQASKGLLTTRPSCQDAVVLIRAIAGTKVLDALKHASVEQVEVSGNTATAEVVDGTQLPNEQVSLQKVGTAWKIAAVPGLGG